MFCLVPYQRTEFEGRPGWMPPGTPLSAVDLRNESQQADATSTGYAVAEYDSPPENAILLDTGNVTRDRDAWAATFGYRPEGDTTVDWTWSHLMDGADDSHADACRPLRCGKPDQVELWLGGRHERPLSYTEKLVQAVLARAVLNEIRDAVEAGDLPEGMERKALKAEADRLGIDWRTLKPKTAAWRGITPLRPETTFNDPFSSGAEANLNTYGSWTTPQHAASFTTGSGYATLKGGASSGSFFAWHPTAMSLANMQADMIDVTRSGDTNYDIPAGVACRGNGSDTAYITSHYQNSLRIHSSVTGGLTQLATTTRTGSAPYRLRVYAVGSTIKGAQTGSAWDLSVTNTAVTSGLYAGMWVYGLGYVGYNTIAQGFYGKDFGQPASISTSPSSGSTAGGTAITITGTGFDDDAVVTIDGNALSGATVISSGEIRGTTPSGTAGAKNVVVTNASTGNTATLVGGFTYAAPSVGHRRPGYSIGMRVGL